MLTTQDHDLTRRLKSADRAHQGQLGLAFFWRATKWVAAAVVGLFLLDLVLQLGAGWRAALTAAFVLFAAAAGAWTWFVARVRRNSLEHTARMLETRDEALGSKLINFLQLRGQIDGQPELTRRLGEQALADYSTRLSAVDFAPLTRAAELARDRKRAGWVLGGIAVVLCAFYPISRLELLRYADPYGDHPPYSLTRIEIAEPAADGVQVAYNAGVVFKATTAGHKPEELYLSFYDPAQPEKVRTVPMYSKGELGFLQEIEGVKSELLVYAHTKNGGSVSKKRRVGVALTPKVDKAFVTVTPPAYTGLKAAENGFQFKDVKALAGSEVKFRLMSNRPLAGGTIEAQTENAPGGAAVEMKPSAENEVSGAFTAKESGRLKFALFDVAQNRSQQELSANLTVTHDLPPDINIENPPDNSFVCEDFKVEARIAATDDYGLKAVRIHRALNDHFSAPKVVDYKQITTTTTERADFDIRDLGVKSGDVISFFAEAVDTCPEPHLARSKTVHLMVISTDEYNDFLRERSDISDIEGKYSQLLNDFHDLADEQKAISEKIKDLQEKMAKGGDPKSLQPELDKLLAKQAELNKKLAAMADRMEKFVREKPLYDLETDLQQTLTQKANEIRDSVQQSNDALKQAAEKLADSSAPQEKRLEALAALQAQSDKQLQQLGQSQKEAEEKILPPLEDAELMNAIVKDLNHIKMLYEAQSAAAEQTKPMENNPNLTDTDKIALKQLAGTEKQIEEAIKKVIADLRDHAKAADELFPKAARSAEDLADAMERGELSDLAKRAANTMLAGNGADSHQSAEKLRQELSNLFDQSENSSGQACQEMDKYLKLKRGLTAKNTFQQMGKNRRFGMGQGQSSPGTGQQGNGGLDGYAVSTGESFGMLGGEAFAGKPGKPGHGSNGQANAAGTGQKTDFDKADVLIGVQAANRSTGGVQTETPMDGYRDVIDAYFNSITK